MIEATIINTTSDNEVEKKLNSIALANNKVVSLKDSFAFEYMLWAITNKGLSIIAEPDGQNYIVKVS
jgi:hypothetical protein